MAISSQLWPLKTLSSQPQHSACSFSQPLLPSTILERGNPALTSSALMRALAGLAAPSLWMKQFLLSQSQGLLGLDMAPLWPYPFASHRILGFSISPWLAFSVPQPPGLLAGALGDQPMDGRDHSWNHRPSPASLSGPSS